MQLCLVDGSSDLRRWARDLAAQLGFELGETIPLADPTFLGLVAQALSPHDRPDPAAWVSAAELVQAELGNEVVADERSLAAAALALQVAQAAARAITGRTGPQALVDLDGIWTRTVQRLGAACPHRPAAQRRLVSQALGAQASLPLAA